MASLYMTIYKWPPWQFKPVAQTQVTRVEMKYKFSVSYSELTVWIDLV